MVIINSVVFLWQWFLELPTKFVALTLNDKIAVLSFISATIGALFAFYKWRKDIALKRADYVHALSEKLRTDAVITKCLHKFDYGSDHMFDENYNPWYGQHFHDNQDDTEKDIDKTLAFLSYICYLRKQKVISKKDFHFFNYALIRALRNFEVQDYLYNLYHFSEANGTTSSFTYLIKYGISRRIFYKDFCNSKACEKNHPVYHKYLNF